MSNTPKCSYTLEHIFPHTTVEELQAANKELRASNEQLRRANEELRQQVDKRTEQLKQTTQDHFRSDESLRKLYRAVEQSPATIVITDIKGTIEFVNPKFTELTGYMPEEAIGQNPRVLKSGGTPDDTYKELWATISAGGTWSGEFLNCGKGGRIFWEHATISALRDEAGDITHYLAVKEDITEKKHILGQLMAAKEQAESANRAKSEFLANMSHEIRTPMNGIMGMSQLLNFTELDEEQKEFLDGIRISSENLLSLINDILDLSKIEAGKVELEYRSFSLRSSINDIITTQRSSVHTRGLTLNVIIPEELPDDFIGDQLRLKQVLLNIVGNAIKFTETGGVTLSVAINTQTGDILHLIFSVIDTGIGIAPESLEQIFAPFNQEDSSTTRKFGGTGLGLSICKKLVELMGGSIRAESTKDVGSSFTLVIPLRQNHTEEHSGSATPQHFWSGEPLHILLAEDQSINCTIANKLLARSGHTLETAKDGFEAVEKWHHGRFDLILMDVEMPEMGGIEATRCIRESEAGGSHHTPIIALTAHALKHDRERLLVLGFDGYVAKPMEMSKLIEEIKQCLHIPGNLTHHGTADTVITPIQIDTEKLAGILQDIEVLLLQNNMAVLDRIGELSQALPETELLELLKHQIKQFDCATARETVKEMYRTFFIPR